MPSRLTLPKKSHRKETDTPRINSCQKTECDDIVLIMHTAPEYSFIGFTFNHPIFIIHYANHHITTSLSCSISYTSCCYTDLRAVRITWRWQWYGDSSTTSHDSSLRVSAGGFSWRERRPTEGFKTLRRGSVAGTVHNALSSFSTDRSASFASDRWRFLLR